MNLSIVLSWGVNRFIFFSPLKARTAPILAGYSMDTGTRMANASSNFLGYGVRVLEGKKIWERGWQDGLNVNS